MIEGLGTMERTITVWVQFTFFWRVPLDVYTVTTVLFLYIYLPRKFGQIVPCAPFPAKVRCAYVDLGVLPLKVYPMWKPGSLICLYQMSWYESVVARYTCTSVPIWKRGSLERFPQWDSHTPNDLKYAAHCFSNSIVVLSLSGSYRVLQIHTESFSALHRF